VDLLSTGVHVTYLCRYSFVDNWPLDIYHLTLYSKQTHRLLNSYLLRCLSFPRRRHHNNVKSIIDALYILRHGWASHNKKSSNKSRKFVKKYSMSRAIKDQCLLLIIRFCAANCSLDTAQLWVDILPLNEFFGTRQSPYRVIIIQ